MTLTYCTRLLAAVGVATMLAAGASAQSPRPAEGPHTYTVFVQSRPIGQEIVTVAAQPDGFVVRGTNRLSAPLDLITRSAEIRYDASWRPQRMALDTVVRGQEINIATTFANGEASSEILQAGTAKPTTKTDKVADDTVVLPNTFLSSYVVLARRLTTQKAGATLQLYIAPQGEVTMRVVSLSPERIETPKQVFAVTRYALLVSNPQQGPEIPVNVWVDATGALLRLNVPLQTLEMAREDIASAATRTTAFEIPGEETVRIPANGFGMAASVAKPPTAAAPLPAVIVIGGPSAGDRDGIVAGVPVLGQIAADLVAAGFAVVRYDRRGVGQSGGRSETTTINDYAEDVRAIVTWIEKSRKDIDKRRIGLVGYGEGGWIAMTAAARDGRAAAVAVVSTASAAGSELVLERQRRVLQGLEGSEAEKLAKVELQRKINAAALSGTGWDEIPVDMRRAAETPWFQSYLAFDPARVMRDVRQPVLIVHGALDTEVPPQHAEKLAELARARKRKVSVDVTAVPGVNHLLLPATTGDVDEYPSLTDRKVSPVATGAIGAWFAKVLSERPK